MAVVETRRRALQRGLWVALAVVAFAWSSGPWRVAVEGLSMAPTLLPGDRLLVRLARRLRRGDLVVIPDPSQPDRWVVKRVAALPGEQVVTAGRVLAAGAGLVVLGDNAAHSTDSRHYGAVPDRDVHRRVWCRYAPAERSGWLPPY
jgi:signal peptidase I